MKYIVKKTGTLIITLLIVSFLSFFAFSVIPGDAALSRLGTEATEEQLAAVRSEMGLDRPVTRAVCTLAEKSVFRGSGRIIQLFHAGE